MRRFHGALSILLCLGCATEPPCATCGSGDPRAGDAGGGGDDDRGDIAGGDLNLAPSDPGPSTFSCGGPRDVTLPRLWPEPGELYYVQIGLTGAAALGEAALMVFGGGEIVFIDTGNDSHHGTVVGVLDDVITQINAHGGFAPRSTRTADHVILTHNHADHTDGLEDLLAAVTLSGRVVHRGYYDMVGVNGNTIGKSCDALAANPGVELELCAGVEAPCNDAGWMGTYPAASCSPVAANGVLDFGADSGIDIIAVNGTIGTHSYEDDIGAFLTENNGENARSVVGVVRQGDFRLLFNGDLTGGGSTTDAVEGYYVPHISGASDIDALGVDVLHTGHHGRNTSTSNVFADALLPSDGLARNAVMGISEAHYNSPHDEVINTLFDGRLGAGRGWTTTVAFLGTSHADLVDAGEGHIVVRTHDGGQGYYLQAVDPGGAVLLTRRYDTIKACP